MAGWLNSGSLVLGLIAWVLPVINNNKLQKRGYSCKKWVLLSMSSFSACAVSLYLQIRCTAYLVEKPDLSALMDTAGATAFAASVLLVVTLLLNAISAAIFLSKPEK